MSGDGIGVKALKTVQGGKSCLPTIDEFQFQLT